MNYSKALAKPKITTQSGCFPRKSIVDGNKEKQALLQSKGTIFKDNNPNKRSETKATRSWDPPQRKYDNSTYKCNIPVLSKRINYLKIKEYTLDEKKELITRCLDKSEFIFKWKPRQGKPVDEPHIVISRLQKKNEEIRNSNNFRWRSFVLHLIISYELFKEKKVSLALEKLEDLHNIIIKKSNSTSEMWLFITIEEALWHVITASKAFIHLENNQIDEAYKLIQEIQPVHTMKQKSQAGIHGIRAAVYMEFGHRGNLIALTEAMKAVEIDRTNGEWHFLVGNCLGRIRRVSQCYELVDPSEVKALNKAIEFDKINANYKVHLAQTLGERAFKELKKVAPKYNSELYKKIRNTFLASKHMIMNAREMQPNCPHLLTRCALAMTKLTPDIIDLKFTRECIDKALELAPDNPMTNHVKAIYNERFGVEPDVYLEAYQKAAGLRNFGAAMDLVRIHYNRKKPNIIEELENLAEEFGESCQKQVVYMQAGSYFLFIKKNFVQAVKYYQKVIDLDPNSYAMKFHKPMFFPLKNPINIFDIILEEMEHNTEWKSFSPEDSKVLRMFLIDNREKCRPNNAQVERLNVQKVLEMSRKLKAHYSDWRKRKNMKQKNHKKMKKWHGKIEVRNKKGIINQINSSEKTRSFGQRKFGNGSKRESNRKEGSNKQMELCNSKDTNFTDRRNSISSGSSSSCRGRESSASSVDSDYYRDTRADEGSFLSHCEKIQSQSGHRYQDDISASSFAAKYSFSKRQHSSSDSSHSRDSSISDMAMYKVDQHLRYSQDISTQRNTEIKKENKLELTIENLMEFNSKNTKDLERQLSYMSISSAESGHDHKSKKCNSEEFDSKSTNNIERRMSILSISSAESDHMSQSKTLSVMERVKQSYNMLGYKNHNKNIQKNSKKNGSSQSLNKQEAKKNWNSINKHTLSRSESTQSLNIQKTNKNLLPENYKPAIGFKPPSTRSLLFMPKFSSKTSETAEKSINESSRN